MTDRRRNLFILLFILGLIAASLVVVATKPTKLGLDLKGGASLVYQAKPTKQTQVTGEAIDRTIEIMRERVDKFGVAEPEIQRTGEDQIDVSLPDVSNADQAAEPGRQDGADVLLRLGAERPRPGLPAGRPDEPHAVRRDERSPAARRPARALAAI